MSFIGFLQILTCESCVICEKHFTPDDYEVNVHGNRVLKKSAVPSVFDFPAHLKKKPTAQRRVLKRKREESTSKETDQTLDICEAVEEPENDPISVDGNLLLDLHQTQHKTQNTLNQVNFQT
ncbi:unnamed protein product [Acanthoscelides obtectus]|uniref:THAP-type domain-containing protein n=1 Tax=Acanthoscelides obtectus TaxID=200917 RepID=A0A9P0QIA6_ACAOB|nr:unnamed protein product [Acanthoscelides obtectus]CAK1684535.1 hypothetical protein AOBTE_LOCUS34919 [Acanthoscelides obtectus]